MTRRETLPLELVWQDDGHVGDVALAAIADGELDLVPDGAISHAGACDDCTARLGEQALLSLSATEALMGAEPELGLAPARRPLPVLSILLALAIAALGAAPALIEVASGAPALPEILLRGLLLGTRALAAVVRALAAAEAGTWVAIWASATAVLVALGVLVARAARPTEETA
jgi:hypothetical protein